MGSSHPKPCPMFHERFAYCSHFYELPHLRKMTILVMILMACNHVLTAYYYWMHWDFRHFIKNAFMVIISCFEMQCTVEALLCTSFHFEAAALKKQMWSLSDAGPEVVREIRDGIQFLRYMRIFVTFLLLVSALVCLPISGDLREFSCILYLVEDFDERVWFPFLNHGVTILKLFLALNFSNPLYTLICLIGDCSDGMKILREKIRSIEDTFGLKEIWSYDAAYQKFVELTLKRCIREHHLIIRHHRLAAKVMNRNLFAVFLMVVVLYTSFYFNVKMNMSDAVLMKSLFIVLLCVFFSYLFTGVGQEFKDECEDLYRDLCQCPWYLWSPSNKSLYYMFLIHTKEPLTIRSFNLELDFGIFVQVGKTTMSLLTAIDKLAS